MSRVGHTYACAHLHIVFSTKDRVPLIDPEWQARMYSYAGGIARANKCTLLAAGGMPDHVHFLVQQHPTLSTSDLLRLIKANTSGWVHRTFPSAGDFAWQRGFGAFSVSLSNISRVRRYIDNQAEHHKRMTFQEEFIALLQRHEIEYDPRYLWD